MFFFSCYESGFIKEMLLFLKNAGRSKSCHKENEIETLPPEPIEIYTITYLNSLIIITS